MKPGSYDVLHFEDLFEFKNKYGIPELDSGNVIDVNFLPFNVVKKCNGVGIHCFVYDYYLERIWKNPFFYIKYLEKSKVFFTPDFSLYTDIPLALQVFNTYRNRWVGAIMQENGINVIPTIGWSDQNSFDFAFCGVKYGSTVAISSVGIKKNTINLFKNGVEELKERINPSIVYVYGEKEREYLSSLFECIFIDSFSKNMRRRIKNG